MSTAAGGRRDRDGYRGVVGLNPFGKRNTSGADIALVVTAFVVATALVAWAFLA